MKHKFILITLIFSLFTTNAAYSQEEFNCEVNDAYRYVSIGVGPIIFIPNVGIGYRERHMQRGFDAGLSFSTIGVAHQLTAHVVGHYYLSPYKENSVYLGLGLMGSGFITNSNERGLAFSPDFVFGKMLKRDGETRHFIEMHVAVPSFWVNHKFRTSHCLPLMYVKYGSSF